MYAPTPSLTSEHGELSFLPTSNRPLERGGEILLKCNDAFYENNFRNRGKRGIRIVKKDPDTEEILKIIEEGKKR